MRKFIKLTFFIFIFTLFIHNGYAYLIPENEVRELETQDNEICLSRGTNTETEFGIRFYWECRKQLINQRIKESIDLKGKNKFYTTELKRIRKVINNVIDRLESQFKTKMDYYLRDETKYKIVLRGKDEYYYNLLTFLNYNYPRVDVNTKREIMQIINTRKELKISKEERDIKKSLEKFPECIKYNIRTKEFKECINFKYKVEECKIMVENRLKNRDTGNRFSCKQQAIEKYPDHLALYNSEYMELQNEKVDEFNINREKTAEKQRRLAELNQLMSGPRLSKIQLIDLRKFEEKKCLMDKEVENNLFKLAIGNQCEEMLKGGYKIE